MYGFSAKSTIVPLNILGLLMRYDKKKDWFLAYTKRVVLVVDYSNLFLLAWLVSLGCLSCSVV